MASVALHLALAGWFVWQSLPIFVHPTSLAEGDGGLSARVISLAAPPPELIVFPRSKMISLSLAPRVRQPADAKSRRARSRQLHVPVMKKNEPATAGSIFGNTNDGLDHDLRPALPLIFPDPAVSRSDLPAGVAGDVIVEVTIDRQGRVITTRLLQGIGYGVEQKCLATLEGWRFSPATQDGIPIASRQDVHFHFPG